MREVLPTSSDRTQFDKVSSHIGQPKRRRGQAKLSVYTEGALSASSAPLATAHARSEAIRLFKLHLSDDLCIAIRKDISAGKAVLQAYRTSPNDNCIYLVTVGITMISVVVDPETLTIVSVCPPNRTAECIARVKHARLRARK